MNSEPIVQSLLDTDFYKFTMGQFVFHRYADVPVKYAMKNRTSDVYLPMFVSEEDLRRELNHARTVRFKVSELQYLERLKNDFGERIFKDDYLESLEGFRLPEYYLSQDGHQYRLEFSGPWSKAIYWETFALSIVNEFYFRRLLENMTDSKKEAVLMTGWLRLLEKIRLLLENPEVVFSDFGTRRRFAFWWHDQVIKTLAGILPRSQFTGTSNVYLAKKYGLKPIGTMAHELFMVMSGIMRGSDKEILASAGRILDEWWDEYGPSLSIALPDTWGSEFFFKIFGAKRGRDWKGMRQDSGDPIAFGKRQIAFYESNGVDPSQKLLVPSDSLNVPLMINIRNHFAGRIKTNFGLGTNLTNDFGFRTLSIVVKTVEACGYGLVKLSDNIAKAIGKPEDIEHIKRLVGYNADYYKECVS